MRSSSAESPCLIIPAVRKRLPPLNFDAHIGDKELEMSRLTTPSTILKHKSPSCFPSLVFSTSILSSVLLTTSDAEISELEAIAPRQQNYSVHPWKTPKMEHSTTLRPLKRKLRIQAAPPTPHTARTWETHTRPGSSLHSVD